MCACVCQLSGQGVYDEAIIDRKRVVSMYLDALSASLSRLCDETGLNYEDASQLCHCSSRYFSRIIRRTSVPTIAVLEGLCDGFGKTPNCLLQVSSDTEGDSYRAAMRAEAVRACRWGNGTLSYPACRRCDSTMEREYQAFRDRCGQRLSWRGFDRAAILLPPYRKHELE